MKRLFISMILTAAAFGQESTKFIIAAPAAGPSINFTVTFGSKYTYCLNSQKCVVVDRDGAIVKDDGLTRDELIQLMHEITRTFQASQYSNDAQIDRYQKAIDLYKEETTILYKAYTELLDGLREIQKALQPPPAKPNKAKGKA